MVSKFPKIIDSKDLKQQDIPKPNSDYFDIGMFALTFDVVAETKKYPSSYYYKGRDINNAGDHSTISELRYHLFVEQRKWNHRCCDPDPETMKKMRQILVWLRDKVG